MLLTLLPANASAITKDNIPTKVRFYHYSDESAITIELADATQSIDNIKTDSKNLFAMLTGSELNQEQGSNTDGANNKNSYTIGLRSKKNGTYTVSFDIVDENDKKVETKEIKVYAFDSPIKSITFDGKIMDGNDLTGKSAKVKVTLTSGNTIKKLEYGVYKIEKEENSSRSEVVYKSFKNGEKITFGTKAYYYSNEYSNELEDYSYQSKNFNTGMDAPTYINITYYDKYTKQNETYREYYYKEID
jgi:hypothetical protein